MKPVSDIHVSSNLVLPSPLDLLEQLPPGESDTDFIFQSRRAIREIIFGNDPRLLVIAGPCSIHDIAAGREYAQRFAKLAEQVKDEMLLVMRVYFEKPRTTVGWKGLIMDPRLDGSNRIGEHQIGAESDDLEWRLGRTGCVGAAVAYTQIRTSLCVAAPYCS